MSIKQLSIIVAFLILLIPSTVFAEGTIKTGYDLYENIKLMDTAQSPDDFATVMFTMGYLHGYLDSLILIQDSWYNKMFPPGVLSEDERNKLSKEIGFCRLNIPKSGLAGGQLILIYKKFAEKHPKNLNMSARVCIFQSLVETYGWK